MFSTIFPAIDLRNLLQVMIELEIIIAIIQLLRNRQMMYACTV